MKKYICTLLLLILLIHPSQFEIGKCYQAIDPNPFNQSLVIVVLDKQNSYIKYSFFRNSIVFHSESESSLGKVNWKEVDCSNLAKIK